MKSPAYTAYYNPYDGSIIFYKHSTNSTFFPAAIQPSGFILYPKFLSFGYGWLASDYYESIVKYNTIFTAQSRNDLIGKCSRKYLLKHHPEALL